MDIIKIKIEYDNFNDIYREPTNEEILNLVKFFPDMLNSKVILERIRNIKKLNNLK